MHSKALAIEENRDELYGEDADDANSVLSEDSLEEGEWAILMQHDAKRAAALAAAGGFNSLQSTRTDSKDLTATGSQLISASGANTNTSWPQRSSSGDAFEDTARAEPSPAASLDSPNRPVQRSTGRSSRRGRIMLGSTDPDAAVQPATKSPAAAQPSPKARSNKSIDSTGGDAHAEPVDPDQEGLDEKQQRWVLACLAPDGGLDLALLMCGVCLLC